MVKEKWEQRDRKEQAQEKLLKGTSEVTHLPQWHAIS